jgi:transglutaminase-like putative cysteine protease
MASTRRDTASDPGPTSDPVGVYLAPGEYVDSDHPAVRARAADLAAGAPDPVAAARRLYDHVRDLPYRAGDLEDLATYRASHVLAVGHGYCVSKAALFAALARATGIPARVAFADVRNHLASPRLRRAMGTDLFAWHGYVEVLLGDGWVKTSPTFDTATCRRAGVPPLEWDGRSDALLQAFDGGGTMDYVRLHGTFHDVPARFLAAEMPRLYPFTRDGGIVRFVEGEASGASDAAEDPT